MSVIIRGMKMPTSCYDCNCFIRDSDGSDYCCLLMQDIEDNNKRDDDCPLVEIPPHGRLGDLDAMAFDESEAYMSAQAKLGRDVITTGLNSIVHRKIQRLIMDTPTIIESEVSK